MSAPGNDPVRPDWYPDPTGRHEFRYHNGVSWTGDVSTDGDRWVDPISHDRSAPRATHAVSSDGPANGHAVAAVTCGIIAIALGWMPVVFVVGAVLAVLAIVFGVSGMRRARSGARGASMARAGLITGVGGILVSIGGLVFTVALLRALDRYENPSAHRIEITECVISSDAVEVAGVLRNEGDRRAEFTVTVPIEQRGSGQPVTLVRNAIGPVGPGSETSWTARRSVSIDEAMAAEAECLDPEVNGPLPFGVVPPG